MQEFGRELDRLEAYYQDYARADERQQYYEGACDAMHNVKVLTTKIITKLMEEQNGNGIQLQEQDRIL